MPWSAEEMLDGQHQRADVPYCLCRSCSQWPLAEKTGGGFLLTYSSGLQRPNRRETALNCKRYDLPTVSGWFFDYELKASNQTGDFIFVPNYFATRWQIYFRLSSLARQNSNLKIYSFGRIILHYEWISSLLLPVAKRTRGLIFFWTQCHISIR